MKHIRRVSLAPWRAPLKLSLLHSMCFACVSPRFRAMCYTFSVCLSCSIESAIEVIFLELYSRALMTHIALRACETLWSAREMSSVALSVERERHWGYLCCTPWCFTCSQGNAKHPLSAREIASVSLATERERNAENVFHGCLGTVCPMCGKCALLPFHGLKYIGTRSFKLIEGVFRNCTPVLPVI